MGGDLCCAGRLDDALGTNHRAFAVNSLSTCPLRRSILIRLRNSSVVPSLSVVPSVFVPLLLPLLTVIVPRRVLPFDSIVLGRRFMIRFDPYSRTVAQSKSRRRLRPISPLAAVKPVIPLCAWVIIDFVIRVVIVIVRSPTTVSWSFRNHTPRTEQQKHRCNDTQSSPSSFHSILLVQKISPYSDMRCWSRSACPCL